MLAREEWAVDCSKAGERDREEESAGGELS